MAILAMYELRTKQRYIFRTNAVQEIAGASALITGVYESFIQALEEKGKKVQRNYIFKGIRYTNTFDPFDPDPGEFDGKVLYVGGGALYMLWRDEATAKAANTLLCEMLRDKCYSLSVACGMTKVTGNYDDDQRKLSEDFERVKAFMPPFLPAAMLPFTAFDRKTSMPISERGEDGRPRLCRESWLKRQKYKDLMRDKCFGKNETNFDKMVAEKGRDSLLAVIHIDGNNMGKRVEGCMRPDGKPITDYATAARKIRALSNKIQEKFVTEPIRHIRKCLRGKPLRVIIAGGDDLTIVCNAHDALKVVIAYFDSLAQGNTPGGVKNTSCAGICVFHSHSPFSDAYRIAEECCEQAKKVNRHHGGENMMVDFQHSFGGAIGSLTDMRERDRKDLICRPYVFGNEAATDGIFTIKSFEEAMEHLSYFGRSHIKNLSNLQMVDPPAYELELARLRALHPEAPVGDNDLKMLHDVAQFYDIWSGKGEE